MKRHRLIAALAAGIAGVGLLVAPAATAQGKGPAPQSRMDAAVRQAAGLEQAAKAVPGKGLGRIDPLDRDTKDRVTVYVEGRDRSALAAAVRTAGGEVDDTSATRVRALVPVGALDDLAKAPAVTEIRRPDEPVPLAVTTEGLQPSGAMTWHSDGRKGAGVKVGVIDVGFARLDEAQAAGELPATVQSFDGQCGPDHVSSHGTAMAEIVHDMAPESQLYLACVKDVMGFDDAANWLKQQGVKVVNLSLSFPGTGRGSGVPATNSPDDPQFVVQDLRAGGALVVAGAGNEAEKHWSGTTTDQNGNAWVEIQGTTENHGFSLPNGSEATVELRWDAWPRTNDDLDLYVSTSPAKPTGVNDPAVVGRISNRQQKDTPGGLTPVETVTIKQSGGVGSYWIYLKTNGARQNLRYDLTVHGNASGFARSSAGSIAEPATSPYVLAAGAITPQSAAVDGSVESYSSRGPTIDGRIKPDVVGFTKVTTSVTPGVAGTSTAAAHIAGAAALYKGANPALDPGQLEALLLDSSRRPGRSNDLGYGVLNVGASRVPQAHAGSGYTPLPVRRVYNTYDAPHNGPLKAGEQITLSIPDVPEDTTSVVLNVTALDAEGPTHVDIAADRPNRVPTLAVRPGRWDSVLTFATLDPVDKQLKIRNSSAETHLIIDMVGYFSPSTSASTYFPFNRPVRLDTPGRTLAPEATWTLPVRGVADVPTTATAALLSITAEEASAPMHILAYAKDNPGAWTLNPRPGERTTYTYLVPLGDDGAIRLGAELGSAAVTVDLVGYFGTGDGATYVPMRDVDPMLDTTTGTGSWVDPVHAGQTRPAAVLGTHRVPFQARSAVLSMTAPTSSRPTDLDVSPGDGSWRDTPGLSSDVVGTPNALRSPSTNTSVVPLTSHVVNIHNRYGDADVVAALSGYFVGGSLTAAPTAGPASARWTFDEGSGTTAADSAGSFPVSLAGGAGWTDGRAGKALSLNGTDAFAATSPNYQAPSGGFTLSAWARLDHKALYASVIAQDGTRTSAFALDYRPDTDQWRFVVPTADTDDADFHAVGAEVPVQTGRWTHLTAVHDASAREFRIYVDGALAGVRPDSSVTASTGAITIGRGKWLGAPTDFFPGAIDDARIYTKALTASQVRDLHQSYGGQPPAPEEPTHGLRR